MLNIYRWGTCWIQTGHLSWRHHTIHSSAQDFLIPFWMKTKKTGRKMAGLLVNRCLYDPLHSICFAFCLLAAWEHCLGKKVATERFAGTALAVQSDAGQKSWHLCYRAWIKHGPCFSGGLCLSQHSEEKTCFFSTLLCIIFLSACRK